MKKPTNEWLGWLIERECYENVTADDKEYFLNNYSLGGGSAYKEKSFVKLCHEVSEGICLLSDKDMVLFGKGDDACSIDHVEAYKADNPTLACPNTLVNLVPTRVDSNSSKGDKPVDVVNKMFDIDYMARVASFNAVIVDAVLKSLYRDFVNDRVKDLPQILNDVQLVKTRQLNWRSPELERYGKGKGVKKYFEEMLGYTIEVNSAAKNLFELNRDQILEWMRAGKQLEEIVNKKHLKVSTKGKEEFFALCDMDDEIRPLITSKTESAKMIDFLHENEDEIRASLANGVKVTEIANKLRLNRDMTLLKLFINNMSARDEYEAKIADLEGKIEDNNVNHKEIARALHFIDMSYNGDINGVHLTGMSMDEDTVSVKLSKVK